MNRSIILTNEDINNKTRRIAYQIFENNIKEKKIVLAGIADNGFLFAQRIEKVLSSISDIEIELCKVTINKKKPIDGVETSLNEKEYKNQSLVLVDDVLNTGTTLMYAVKHFLNVPLKRFKTAILVNRNHKKYPIKADFKGISLSTSLQEHISVEFEKNSAKAYLN